MQSFRVLAKKMVPPNQPVTMAAVAQRMNLGRPVSLVNMMNQLNSSLPDFKIFDSGQLGPSTTTGWGQVGFTINGGVAFRGAIHESGFLGHDYTFAMAIANYVDPSDKLIVFLHSGSVEGTSSGLPFGTPQRDDSWNGNASIDPFISDHWDSIKSSGWHASLNVDTDPGFVIQLVVQSLIDGGLLGAGAAFIVAAIQGGGAHWTQGKDPEGNPSLGIEPNEPQQ
jgi:hypothetical protein